MSRSIPDLSMRCYAKQREYSPIEIYKVAISIIVYYGFGVPVMMIG